MEGTEGTEWETYQVDVQVVVCDKLVCAVQEQVSSVPVPYSLYDMNYKFDDELK